MNPVNLADKFAQVPEPWSPSIVGELNGQHVKVVKLAGEFVIVPRGGERTIERPERL